MPKDKFSYHLKDLYNTLDLGITYTNFVSKLKKKAYFKEGENYIKKLKPYLSEDKKYSPIAISYDYYINTDLRNTIIKNVPNLKKGAYFKSFETTNKKYKHNLKKLYDKLGFKVTLSNILGKCLRLCLVENRNYIKVVKKTYKGTKINKKYIQHDYFIDESVKKWIIENKEALDKQVDKEVKIQPKKYILEERPRHKEVYEGSMIYTPRVLPEEFLEISRRLCLALLGSTNEYNTNYTIEDPSDYLN